MNRLLLSILGIFISLNFLNAQDTSKIDKKTSWWKKNVKTSKKELYNEIGGLEKKIDSLMNEIAFNYIPIQYEDSLGLYGLAIEEEVAFIDSATTAAIVNPDSLLSIWYHREGLFENQSSIYLEDTTEICSHLSDSVLIDRLERMDSFISIEYNNILRNHILFYAQKAKKNSERVLGLSTYYMPIFEEIFDMYDLPIELSSMAIIESSLNPIAVSRAKAKGMWQFMYTTALRYDLTINSYVDERLDPIKSAHSAAKYLKDAYTIFGDWGLAIASYNCGAGNVTKAIRRSGGKRNFWDVYYHLPKETRGYVPGLIAALYIQEYYKEHDLVPRTVEMPPFVDTIKINKMVHFEQISHYTGISVNELKKFNPQYLHNIIPGNEREYELKLPFEYVNAYIDHEKEIHNFKADNYFNPAALKKIKQAGSNTGKRSTHKVKSGETLGHIALKYNVKVADLRRWNGLKNNTIRIGQTLALYNAKSTSSSSSSSSTKTSVKNGYVTYTVKNGDSLWEIANKFKGVSLNQILSLNNLSKNSKIYPGMNLKIKKA